MLKTLVLLMVLSLTPLVQSRACSCLSTGTPSDALVRADAVFSGKVAKVENRSVSSVYGTMAATLIVERIWKGIDSREVTVWTSSPGSCGFPFLKGGQYLVYAYLMPKDDPADQKVLVTSVCSRTKTVAGASADLEALGDGTLVSRSGGVCGGPSNVFALQMLMFVGLFAGIGHVRSRRRT